MNQLQPFQVTPPASVISTASSKTCCITVGSTPRIDSPAKQYGTVSMIAAATTINLRCALAAADGH